MKTRFPMWRGDVPFESRRAALWMRCVTGDAAMRTAITVHPFEVLEAVLPAPLRARDYHVNAEGAACVARVDRGLRERYTAAFLLWQIGRFGARFAESGLPPEFAAHYADCFHRMMDELESGCFVADFERDLYVKDLALTRAVLIPAVGQLIFAGAGIPRAVALRASPRHWFRRRPFLELHTHDPMNAAYFNLHGWEETWRLAAVLLRSDPSLRGVLASSWFFDPALASISPRLMYLHERPQACGARLVRIGADEDSRALATATSATRRMALAEGRYLPTRYAVIWPRARLLEHYG